MRMFIALELPEEIQAVLESNIGVLQDRIRGRFVSPSNLHVTLAFLGDVEPTSADTAAEALGRAIARWSSAGISERSGWSERGPIETELAGLGFFGKPSSATLWQGFSNPDVLEELGGYVREALSEDGIWFDQKPMRAHATLARRVDLRGISQDDLSKGILRCSGIITTASLFRSETIAKRLVYTPEVSFNL